MITLWFICLFFIINIANCTYNPCQKFKALEKRTNEVTKVSTERRIKHLQNTALKNGTLMKIVNVKPCFPRVICAYFVFTKMR